MVIATAMALGFFGSLHCAVMCGPLAVAGCSAKGTIAASRVAGYFGGRVVAYSFLGAAFGAAGAHLGCRIALPKLQNVVLACVALVALIRGARLLLSARRRRDLVQLGTRKPSPVVRFVASMVPRRALTLGVVTGLLPCGMLVAAWGLAASTGRPALGALTMVVFSLASAPALVATLVASRVATTRLRFASSPVFQGVLWCALAMWICARTLLPNIHAGH